MRVTMIGSLLMLAGLASFSQSSAQGREESGSVSQLSVQSRLDGCCQSNANSSPLCVERPDLAVL